MGTNSENFRKPFHVLTVTLLGLLFPLSLILLARLSYASLISTLSTGTSANHQIPFLLSLFFQPNNYPSPLHGAVAALVLAALLHSLTGKITVTAEPPPVPPPSVPSDRKSRRLCMAWALLCALQVSVGLGIEGSISSGIEVPHFAAERRSVLSRVIFFLGMHEAMWYWCRTVVKPVVDDTVFGEAIAEGWQERAVVAAAYGCLWWWRLREEVETLAVVGEVKNELMMDVGMVDFVNWWVYYLIDAIGRVRIVKAILWTGMVLFWRGEQKKCGASSKDEDIV